MPTTSNRVECPHAPHNYDRCYYTWSSSRYTKIPESVGNFGHLESLARHEGLGYFGWRFESLARGQYFPSISKISKNINFEFLTRYWYSVDVILFFLYILFIIGADSMLCSVIDANVGENVTSSRYRKSITPSKTFDTFGDFVA